MSSVKEEKRKDASEEAVFPCVMKIMPQCVFNKKDPIVVGVDILDGVAKVSLASFAFAASLSFGGFLFTIADCGALPPCFSAYTTEFEFLTVEIFCVGRNTSLYSVEGWH